MARNTLVLDLETQKTFNDVGRQNLHKLKVSVAGVYDYAADAYLTFEEHQMTELEERLKASDLIVGFNVRRFDLPVLAPYLFTSIENFHVLDLMEEIERVRGHRVSLRSVAQATLGVTKTGEGYDAVDLYRRGRIDELKAYCLNDVKLTKEIYDFGCEQSKVFFISNRDWKTYEIPIHWGTAVHREKEPAFPTSLF